MAAVMTMLATAGTTFEARTSAGTTATAIWPATAAAAIVSAAIVAIASAAAAAERPLESGAGIASDAGGVTREIRARLGSTGTRSAGFPGKKDAVVFRGRRSGSGFGSSSLDLFMLHGFVGIVITDGCSVQRTLMRSVCFRFAERMRIERAGLNSGDLVGCYIGRINFARSGVNFLVLFYFVGNVVCSFGFFFRFGFVLLFFLKHRATDEGIGCGFGLRLLMVSFDEAGW